MTHIPFVLRARVEALRVLFAASGGDLDHDRIDAIFDDASIVDVDHENDRIVAAEFFLHQAPKTDEALAFAAKIRGVMQIAA